MTDRLVPYTYAKEGETVGYMFWCPGCKATHSYAIKLYRDGGNPVWDFNGNVECPTFSPSLLYETKRESGPHRCHIYLTDGKIHFLPDCTHELAGKVVDLPEYPENR
jgi:hypothetical protein